MERIDLHNFGQAVRRMNRGSENVFQKPRPIYWEWLFFGGDSPLSSFFNQSRQTITPKDVLFNLSVEMDKNFCGTSREVLPEEGIHVSHYHSVGVLLAYCYIFGIRDLHRHNLIKTKTHLQVVDVEIVFCRLLLPHETLLLPFKEVGAELCGASKVLELNSALSKAQVQLIIDGYIDVFENVLSHLESIRSVFDVKSLSSIAIRHILRDTHHYRSWIDQKPEIPFFESEVSQLKRGDIPYYFKFLGRPEVFEYSSPEGAFQAVELPEIFLRGAARDAENPLSLLNVHRIKEHLLGAGLLYLAKTFLPKLDKPFLEGDGYNVCLLEKEITVSTPIGNFKAARV